MKIILTLLVALIISVPVFSQGEPGEDPDVPFDGGLILLLAGGAGYAAKKGYDLRKKINPGSNKEDE